MMGRRKGAVNSIFVSVVCFAFCFFFSDFLASLSLWRVWRRLMNISR